MIKWWLSTRKRKYVLLTAFIFLLIISIINLTSRTPSVLNNPVTGEPSKWVETDSSWHTVLMEPLLAASNIIMTSSKIIITVGAFLIFVALAGGILGIALKDRSENNEERSAYGKTLFAFLKGSASAIGLFLAYMIFIVYARPVPWHFKSKEKDVVIADLETHSTLSHDGIIPPVDNLVHHRNAGYDVVSFTEHDNTDSLKTAKQFENDDSMPAIIPGLETPVKNLQKGDSKPEIFYVTILGIHPGNEFRKDAFGEDLTRITAYARGQNAVIIGKLHLMDTSSIPQYLEAGMNGIEYIDQYRRIIDPGKQDDVMRAAESTHVPLINVTDWHGWGGTLSSGVAIRIPGSDTMTRRQLADAVIEKISNKQGDDFEPFIVGDYGDHGMAYSLFTPLIIFRYLSGISKGKLASLWFWLLVLTALCPILSVGKVRPVKGITSLLLFIFGTVILIRGIALWRPLDRSYPYQNHVAGFGIFIGLVLLVISVRIIFKFLAPIFSRIPTQTPLPNESPDEVQSGYSKRLIIFDVCVFIVLPAILRLIWINLFNLCEDEAYYWEWSRRLALSYHDQGPMVAYFIRIGTTLFGNTIFGIRFMSVISFAAATAFIYLFVRRIYDRRTAIYSLIFINLIPVFSLGAVLMTYDTVQALFWCASLYFFSRAMRLKEAPNRFADDQGTAPGHMGWWFLSGLSVGLGFDGKYTSLIFLFAALFYMLLNKRERAFFGYPHPYLLGLVALLAVSPVLYWNFRMTGVPSCISSDWEKRPSMSSRRNTFSNSWADNSELSLRSCLCLW